MGSRGLRCVLEGCNASGSINVLNATTLPHVEAKLAHRKKHKLKYHSMTFDNVTEHDGFHMECYRKFVGLSEKQRKLFEEAKRDGPPQSPPPAAAAVAGRSLLRSSVTSPVCSSAGVFGKICFICGRKDRKIRGERQPLILSTKDLEATILRIVLDLDDEVLINKLQIDKKEMTICDFVAKEVRYHPICRTELQNRSESQRSKRTGSIARDSWHEVRDIHAAAFDVIKDLVSRDVMQADCAYFLKDLVARYKQVLIDRGGSSFTETTFTSQHLQDKLLDEFGSSINFNEGNKKRGNIVYNAGTSFEAAVRKAFESDSDTSKKLREVALLLRKSIVDNEKTPIPGQVTLPDLIKGEIQTPKILTEFLEYLLMGLDTRRGKSDIKKRRLEAIAHSIIYAATGGRIKPCTQIILALVIKSLSGCRKILDILNRLGHGISYHLCEEIETELAHWSLQDERLTPYGMSLEPKNCAGVAFDNFDRFVETLTGKDTLHDTVGIVYEDLTAANNLHITSTPGSSSQIISTGNKRRRAFITDEVLLEPYYKKPKIKNSSLLPLDDERRNHSASCVEQGDLLDFLWMLSCYLLPADTPMWVGWNSKIPDTQSQVQKVFYLPQLDKSPTSNTVVIETLNMANQIAREIGREDIVVTYDLAIAKLAMQIQNEESPKFDNILIFMGQFHTEMAFFKSIGKFIAESGGPAVLIASTVLAAGSLNGFVSGKHYNRCKRIHPLFACALEILHFKLFLSSKEEHLDTLEEIKRELRELLNEGSSFRGSLSKVSLSKEMNDLIEDYNSFREETRSGINGKTAQYWMMYIDLIALYHQFSRSTRSGNFQLYVHSLEDVTDLFFRFNLQNYSRWTVRFHDNLLRINEDHPSLAQEFQKGRFGVKRTSKNFSRMPVDLTLESTINADAASQRTGIRSLTNNISARKRWAHTHFLRMGLVSHLLDKLDLNKKEDISADLKPCRLQKNAEALKMIIESLEDSVNPFSKDVEKDVLYNITTGKAASQETTDFLLSVREEGKKARLAFIKDVNARPTRFEEAIKRGNLKTFANGVTVTVKRGKSIKEVKMERNLYGRLLTIALDHELDIPYVLSFPLTLFPMNLCHLDGTMASTKKDKIIKPLEERVSSARPLFVNCYIVDGMFFLRTIVEFPKTLGRLSEVLLNKLCSLKAERVDVVFDTYATPSIKDSERQQRGADFTTKYQIHGPLQETPTNMKISLKSVEFKKNLIEFLFQDWRNEKFSDVVGSKTVYITSQRKCVSFRNISGVYTPSLQYGLFSEQEEADYRILTHIEDTKENSNIVVRANDTDILINLIGNQHLFEPRKVWMEIGSWSDNTLRFIDTSAIAYNLGETMAQALPAFHAFTGCDYSPAFIGKGKVRPFNVLLKYPECQQAFARLGVEDFDDDMWKGVESFTCKMYGSKTITSVNDLLAQKFFKSFRPKKTNNIEENMLKRIKGCDGSSFPPCHSVLKNHILRTAYIAGMSRNNRELPSPCDCGFMLSSDRSHYQINWYDGSQYPPSLTEEVVKDPDDVVVDDDEDIYDSDDDENEHSEDDNETEDFITLF